MKKVVTFILAYAAAAVASADGFICQETEGSLNIQVYNHVLAEDGTRSVSVMVVSDDSLEHGNRTIARFSDAKNTLSSTRQLYIAKVDLRTTDSNRRGELIAGTKLGKVDYLALAVDFDYASPVVRGSLVPGHLTVVKRDGEEIDLDMTCSRYLKN